MCLRTDAGYDLSAASNIFLMVLLVLSYVCYFICICMLNYDLCDINLLCESFL